MQVILQGSLEHFPTAELLPLFVSHPHSGALLLEGDGKRIRTKKWGQVSGFVTL